VTQGSLALRAGVLYVGRHEKTAHVRPYDLDGRPLGDGFSFRGPHGEPCTLGGLDVDTGHHLWVADSALGRVRTFSVFGREVSSFGSDEPLANGRTGREHDERGALASPVDVTVAGEEDGDTLVVASAGWRRHAVQLFHGDGTWIASLRPEGNPMGRFNGVRRVQVRGPLTYVCEARAGRVQVFRDGEFHFLFKLPLRTAGRFEPVAIAPLEDGRMVLATGGQHSGLFLLDASGRVLRVLAEAGSETGQVFEPGDVAVEEGASERETRLAVVDRDADRVQVFTLEGRCYGALEELPGQAL
jgi:hypothetical protein